MRVILVCNPLPGAERRKAKAIAAEIKGNLSRQQPVEAVYTVPSASAAATGIAEELGLASPNVLHGLMTPDGVALGEDGPAALSRLIKRMQDDVWAVIEGLRDAHPDEVQVVAVVDAPVVYAAVCRALSLPVEDHIHFRVDPGSLNAIAFRQQRTILSLLNESCHSDALDR